MPKVSIIPISLIHVIYLVLMPHFDFASWISEASWCDLQQAPQELRVPLLAFLSFGKQAVLVSHLLVFQNSWGVL